MSDLVERLREVAERADANYPAVIEQAADRIEQLEEANELMLTDIRRTDVDMLAFKARIEQLEAALKPLCCTCDRAASDECSRSEVDCPFWNARSALGEERT